VRAIVLPTLGLLTLTACSQSHAPGGAGGATPAVRPAVVATPTLDELPSFPTLEPTLAADVGVQGGSRTPPGGLVGRLEEPEYTAEERKQLGLDRRQGRDFLALYQPEPTPADGVYPDVAGVVTLAAGLGGPSLRVVADRPAVAVGGTELEPGQVSPTPATVVRVQPAGPPAVGVGPGSGVQVEIGPPSKVVARKQRTRL